MLVNNAGRTQRAFVVDSPLQIDRQLIELNVVGVLSLTKCVLPHMLARRHGYILVTSSVTGKLRTYSPPTATINITKLQFIHNAEMATDQKPQNHFKKVILPTITSPESQRDAE